MIADSFITHLKAGNIAIDADTRFDTSNYELGRPLSRANNKNLIGLMKDK